MALWEDIEKRYPGYDIGFFPLLMAVSGGIALFVMLAKERGTRVYPSLIIPMSISITSVITDIGLWRPGLYRPIADGWAPLTCVLLSCIKGYQYMPTNHEVTVFHGMTILYFFTRLCFVAGVPLFFWIHVAGTIIGIRTRLYAMLNPSIRHY